MGDPGYEATDSGYLGIVVQFCVQAHLGYHKNLDPEVKTGSMI